MKKMKCTSCGAELKVEKDNEYAVCEHCGSKYKLNESVDINIKMDDNMKDVIKFGFERNRKISKVAMIIFVVIFIGVLVFFFTIVRSSINRQEESRKQMEERSNKSKEEYNKTTFNTQFAFVSGTKYGSEIKIFLDVIVNSNKVNERKVSLIYKDEKTIDEDKIINIKHTLKDNEKYEVSTNYDNDGYINEIKVEEIA
jgi:DNA-directed RNA polymerase subunit RPC12/RpoP